ncbi:hypothetical protein H6F83_26590 [Coleofasciculus sp. FACHB-125]|nr:hypothetical protein [Coleofasciculus sp. FACHB-125]
MRSPISYLPTLTASVATLHIYCCNCYSDDRLSSHECDRIASNASILFIILIIWMVTNSKNARL